MPRNHAPGANALGLALTLSLAGCASSGPSGESSGSAPPGNPSATPAPAETTVQTNTPVDPPVAPPDESMEGIFNSTQADRGGTTFDEVCSECHTTSEFRGRTFQSNWGRRTVYSLFRTVRSTMPDDNPGGLDEQVYLDVVAYILSMNGHSAGSSELAADSPMREVRIAPPGVGRQ